MSDVSAPEVNGQDVVQLAKLCTVILGVNDDLRVDLREEHFAGLDETERNESVESLLRMASIRLLDESEKMLENPELAEMGTPGNPGSLYDEIIFECSLYIDKVQQMHINTTFGRAVDSSVPLHENVRNVSDALAFIANEINSLAPGADNLQAPSSEAAGRF